MAWLRLLSIILILMLWMTCIAKDICDGFGSITLDATTFLVPRGICIQTYYNSSYKLGGKKYASSDCDPSTAITNEPDIDSSECLYDWSYLNVLDSNDIMIYRYPFITTTNGSKSDNDYCVVHGDIGYRQICLDDTNDIKTISYDATRGTRTTSCWIAIASKQLSEISIFNENDGNRRRKLQCNYYEAPLLSQQEIMWIAIGCIGGCCLCFCFCGLCWWSYRQKGKRDKDAQKRIDQISAQTEMRLQQMRMENAAKMNDNANQNMPVIFVQSFDAFNNNNNRIANNVAMHNVMPGASHQEIQPINMNEGKVNDENQEYTMQ